MEICVTLGMRQTPPGRLSSTGLETASIQSGSNEYMDISKCILNIQAAFSSLEVLWNYPRRTSQLAGRSHLSWGSSGTFLYVKDITWLKVMSFLQKLLHVSCTSVRRERWSHTRWDLNRGMWCYPQETAWRCFTEIKRKGEGEKKGTPNHLEYMKKHSLCSLTR